MLSSRQQAMAGVALWLVADDVVRGHGWVNTPVVRGAVDVLYGSVAAARL
ncbi:MAG: hypothetical protein K2X41_11510 [Hyphomicrobium sp.]|nr:hypothetical protein [Hyphomicrobium sp.]